MSREGPGRPLDMDIRGRARMLPDNVNTDYIISSRRKRDITEARLLTGYILEDVVPPLDSPIAPGDILVAGHNFGCGSAMEIAVEVLKVAGVGAVIARSFARTFYRNALNQGLLVLDCDPAQDAGEPVREGDQLEVRAGGDRAEVINRTRACSFPCRTPAAFSLGLIAEGGLTAYFQKRGEIPRGRLSGEPGGLAYV